MKTVNYKGYQASVDFDDNTLFVKVLHIDDVLIAEVDKASEVQKEFECLIDEYLNDCKEAGREPSKPFKGSFNVRLTPDQHRLVAMRAANDGVSLNKWVCTAIEEKLECGKLSDRIDGVFSKKKEAFSVRVVQLLDRQSETGHGHRQSFFREARLGHWTRPVDWETEVPARPLELARAVGMKLDG